MRWIALPLLFILSAGPSLHWGDVDAGIQAPLLWSAGMGVFVVLAGWRAPKKGWFASALRGTLIAAIVNVPAYFAGRWLAVTPLDCASLESWFGAAVRQIACGK